ncbi:MAG: hypothetical protein ACOYLG_06045 [Chitinophagaceae bacterium]|jgi:hypothetical protein
MEQRKGLNFFFTIIAIIVGGSLIKEYDVEKRTFEKPLLALIYLLTFLFSVFIIIKDLRKRPKT